MGSLKINENLFLGKQELNRIVDLLDSDGFRKFFFEDTVSFGLVRNDFSGVFTNGRVELGTNSLTIKVNETKIVNKDLNFLYQPDQDNISVPNDGNWYWVQVEYLLSNIEVGIVQIDSQGTLTGTGTKFLDILRGKPDHASVIKFVNSQFNILEYEITDVIDDNNATLAGEFTNEDNLQLVVVGTFDPIALSPADKGIFQYDSLQMNLNQETTANTAPNVQEGVTFNLARVMISNSQVIIQDKRTEFWNTTGAALLSLVERNQSPLFGIEAVKFDHPSTPRVYNFVEVSWGFRSLNWTVNTSLNTVTISGGNGGRFKDSNAFTTGDFDGWRLYTEDGLYSIISTSTKSGTQFNLELDTLDLNRFLNGSQQLIIVPSSDSIEIQATPNPADITDLPIKFFTYPINRGYVRLDLLVYQQVSSYIIQYRYKNSFSYSAWLLPQSDSSIGYLTETSFNDDGTLKPLIDRVSQTYLVTDTVTPFVNLNLAPNAYGNFVNSIDLNDLGGLFEITDLELLVVSAPSRKFDLTPRTTKQNIVISGSSPLSGDTRLNLVSSTAKNGTTFYVYVKTGLNNLVNTSSFKVAIYQDNTTLLYSFTQDQITKGRQFFKCVFDSGVWTIIQFDNDYGTKETNYQVGSESLNTTDNVEVVSAKKILVISGYTNNIVLNNNAGISLDGIRVRNQKFVNDLSITLIGTSNLQLNSENTPPNAPPLIYYPFAFSPNEQYPVAPNLIIVTNNTMLLRLQGVAAQGYRPTTTSNLMGDMTVLNAYRITLDNYLNNLIKGGTIIGLGSSPTTAGSSIGDFNCTAHSSDSFFNYYTLDAPIANWNIFGGWQQAGYIELDISADNDNKLVCFRYDIFNVGGFYQIRTCVQGSTNSFDTDEFADFALKLLFTQKKLF